MSQRVFDAFVFDLDGTLVDTASELIAAYQKLCIELGGGEKPFEDARKLILESKHPPFHASQLKCLFHHFLPEFRQYLD